MRTTRKLLIASGVAAGLSLVASGAIADPSSTPSDTTIVSVGSETSQLVNDALATAYTGTPGYASYDATPTGTITPKVGCASITRPNGTTAGINALAAGAHPTGDSTDYCIDIARSVRGPATTDPTGIAFVPYAEDAVTWSAAKTGNAPATLTLTQLKAIYSCDASILGGSATGPVTWNEVGGTGTDAVVPVQPPTSSGIRSSFLTAIGVTTVGSCVTPTDGSVEQNEGTNPIFTGPSEADIVFPYSTAVYLSQTIHGQGTATNSPGPLTLREIGGVASFTGKGTKELVNKKAPVLITLFNVVRSTGKTKKYVPTYLQAFLGADNDKGYICSKSSETILKNYGFLTIGSKCGKVTLTH
jgi:ABC-type phosphate transport system substrate-binding protein